MTGRLFFLAGTLLVGDGLLFRLVGAASLDLFL